MSEQQENIPVAEGGVIAPPAAPEPIAEDRYRDFMAERMEVYQEDPTVPPEIALQAVQTEAMLRVADEVRELRETLQDPTTFLTSIDLDAAVTRWRMFLKMMENLAKSDKKRAEANKDRNFVETMAKHAEAANKS